MISPTPALESLSDSELSEVFAREVAGWCLGDKKKVQYSGYWYDAEGTVTNLGVHNLKFATSADAVIPHLEKWSLTPRAEGEFFKMLSPLCVEQGWGCQLWVDHHDGAYVEFQVFAPTLARAACIALIKAYRAAKAP